MKESSIKSIFKSFNDLKVLIIGDSMVDAYVWGKVNRISPEAPVPVVAVYKKENRPGGAANVAMNIQSLGATPILCSGIGDDAQGEIFLDLLTKLKLSKEGIIKSKGRVTTVKTRVLGNNHQLLRIDEETEQEINSKEVKQLLSTINSIIKKHHIDVIIFEDYNKGLITPALIKNVTDLAIKKDIPIVVDPKKQHFNEYKKSTLFKPNLKELKEGVKQDFHGFDKKIMDALVDEFRKKQEIENVMVTLSEEGIYINNGKIKQVIPAHKRNISDVSGAGDSVISVAALCVALKLPSVFTAALSNLAGGLVCETVGVVSVDKEKLYKEALTLDNEFLK